MTNYRGFEQEIYAAGFKWPAEHGWGGEMYNFAPVGGLCYGHAEIVPRHVGGKMVLPKLVIEKLGAAKDDDSVDGVLVVWTAPDPRRAGRTVVGWYQNATVYRSDQEPTGKLKKARAFRDQIVRYRVRAAASDCVVLKPEDRRFTIPPRRAGQTGVPGQFAAFYPSMNEHGGQRLAARLRDYVAKTSGPSSPRSRRAGRSMFQVDVERRAQIEAAAIECVVDNLVAQGYLVEDRQKQNIGYDLIATRDDETLCVEVKGRSGKDICADFSPNEYASIRLAERGRHQDGSYRICIVTSALEKPTLSHFAYWPRHEGRPGGWVSIDGTIRINLRAVTAARAEAEG